MVFSVGMYSTLNQQMSAYRKERNAEDIDDKRLRYKMLKHKAEERGLDTSAQRVASMLERVSKVIEGPEELDNEGPHEHYPEASIQQSVIGIILQGIRNKNLNEVWQRIVSAHPENERQIELQKIMKGKQVKAMVNDIIGKIVDNAISERKGAEKTFEVLKEEMPPAVPDSVIADTFNDLNSQAPTAETDTTVEGDDGVKKILKTPSTFTTLLKGTYTRPTAVYRKNNAGANKQFLKGADLYIVPDNGVNQLKSRGSAGTAYKDLTLAQFNQLKENIPIL